MTYAELRQAQQKRINALPLYFAFSDKQFEETMSKLGLTANDTDKVCSIGFGGFCLNSDAKLVVDTFNETSDEMEKALEDDDFLQSAFEYEMANHEFGYTYDPEDTLESLGFSLNDLEKNERIRKIFLTAKRNYLSKFED